VIKCEIKQAQSVRAISLPLDCRDCLDWSKISTEKTYHNRTWHLSLKHVMVVKNFFFSIHFLCLAFLPHSLHSHILLHLQESPNVAHLISSDTIKHRAMSKTIAYGVHSVTTFVLAVVVVMSGFLLLSINTNRNHAFRWQLVTIPSMCTL
jgi:hypothetical protein